MLKKIIKEIKGYTLVELVLTMALMGILLGAIAKISSVPIQAYIDTLRRADLVDSAEMAIRRMGRDIQRAIPNSVRTKASGSVQALELLNTIEGKQYRAQGPAINSLDFTAADTDFDVWGPFQYVNLANLSYRVVIYNTGAINGSNFDSPIAGTNVYSTSNAPVTSTVPPPGTHVITPTSLVVTLSNPTGSTGHVNISGTGWQFAFPSPKQRMYITDGPVSYLCDTSAGTLTRYWGYTIAGVQPTSFAGGVQSALLASNVSACTFTYLQGSVNRNGVAILRITLTSKGESVTLINEVSVRNVP